MNVLRVAAVVAVMLVFSVIGRATDFFQSVSQIGLAASSSYFDSSRNRSGNATLSNGNLVAHLNTSNIQTPEFTTPIFHSSNKWFFRVTWDNCSGTSDCGVGVATSSATSGDYLGIDANGIGIYGDGNYWINGMVANAPPTGNIGTTFASGDTVDVVVDLSALTIQIAVNGGRLSSTVSIAGLASSNVSPAVNLFTLGDQATYTGQPSGTYSGATVWDGAVTK